MFISTDLTLKQVEEKVKHPVLLCKSEFSRLWYKLDTMFFTPKAYITVDFNCPESNCSPDGNMFSIGYLKAHACTAGLKSLTTSVTVDGIQDCRKFCGEHEYLCSSGIPELFVIHVPSCTYEGDNIVLLLQVLGFTDVDALRISMVYHQRPQAE